MASHSAAGSAAETRWRDVLSGTPDLVSTGATGYRTDPELVRGCLAGSPGAFDLLVHLHQRAVYRLCFRFMGNHEDAADLSQEVFLRAHRGLASFRSKSSLSTWLYRIGVNLCLNRVSLKRPITDSLDTDRAADQRGVDPVERLDQSACALRLRRSIARLPARQRAVVILRVYHELPHAEIARIVGSSVGAVKANFFHAMGNLRRLVGPEDMSIPERARRGAEEGGS
jgi:RNA polymerase sigma-70 factor (ECF subfamily)